jgi:hypothetical protein
MKKSTKAFLAIAIPLLVLLGIYLAFSFNGLSELWSVMTVSFIILVPFGIGALTIYLSPVEKIESRLYQATVPWYPLLAFMVITLAFALEGWACWLMIMPIFMLAASVGGLVAGYLKLRKHKNEQLNISLFILLPLIIAPVEQAIKITPHQYEAYTYIDLHASKAKIWQNVTRVKAIEKAEDKGWLTRTLGFPRPIRAELNYNGVGGYRKAIFDKGLIFHEQVTKYEDGRRMRFTIQANPYEIPATAMDEHVVIGGKYFNVTDGTYLLQRLNTNTYRLQLYSHFQLTTTFNFYASWWAGWIMKDIQNNILQVIKERVE